LFSLLGIDLPNRQVHFALLAALYSILKWWRLEGKSEWRKEDVHKALDALTAKGWLTKRNTSPPEKIYGFNEKFMEEIRKFLNESEKDKGD
jgi:hypothetical protein